MHLAIFDIDDTLFDWLAMWQSSFDDLLSQLADATGLPRRDVTTVIRRFHVREGTSEYPFEGKHLTEIFPALSASVAASAAEALHDARARGHTLYPGIDDVFRDLRNRNVRVVLHTDAPDRVAGSRVSLLGLDSVDAVYSTTRDKAPRRDNKHCALPYRKPDRRALEAILHAEKVAPIDALYVGDSLYRDIAMARDCGVANVHAKYGCNRDGSAYELLREVSHWTDDDIQFEKRLMREREVSPDVIADSPSALRAILAAY